MTKIPSCVGALSLVLAIGIQHASCQTPTATAAPEPTVTASGTPTAADQQKAEQMVQDKGDDRHLAPHDTFYILSYVAVKTDTGVEGFNPGQKVQLVQVNRADHTLIVSDGHAQVEVPPSNLTNDLDVAAAARQKDRASQAQIAAYTQKEQEAYDQFQKDAAAATQKDLDQHRKEVKAEQKALVKEENTPVASTAPSVNTPLSGPDYYGNGGYGYGNPYSYFVEGAATATAAPSTPNRAPAAAAPASAPNNVAAPAAGHAGGGGRTK